MFRKKKAPIGDRVRDGIASWRAVQVDTRKMSEMSDEDPERYARSLIILVERQRKSFEHTLDQKFGVKVRYEGPPDRQRRVLYIADKERFPYLDGSPENEKEFALCMGLSKSFYVVELAWVAICAGAAEAVAEGRDPYRGMLNSYYEYREVGPWTSTPTKQEQPSELVREIDTINLSGWTGSNINLSPERRLTKVLRKIGGGKRRSLDVLSDELPPPTVMAWDELGAVEALGLQFHTERRNTDDPTNRQRKQRGKLVSRVSEMITELGGERFKREKLSGETPPEDVGEEELDLEEFERVEDARQLVGQLDGTARRVGLSSREMQVLKQLLDGKDVATIAHELSIARGTVKSLKHRLAKKLKAARGSLSEE